MLATCYLTCGKIAPDFEQLELSVGESTVAAAVVETTGALDSIEHMSACNAARKMFSAVGTHDLPGASTTGQIGRMASQHASCWLQLTYCEADTGVSRARLREVYKQLGDLGDVAQACRSRQVSLQLCVRCTAAAAGPVVAARAQRFANVQPASTFSSRLLMHDFLKHCWSQCLVTAAANTVWRYGLV